EFGSVYLIDEDKKALIDTGPTPSAGFVLDGLKELGVSPGDIDYIVITHIHLDHGGGAGFLVKNMPEARVLVHQRGARHLVDPSRLVSSALAAQGQVEETTVKNTEVLPIAAERVTAVRDGDTIELGGKQSLRIIEAPGHAPHELCVHESRNNGIFTGDAAGICLGEHKSLTMVNAPPSFDLELSGATIEKLLRLQASRIYYSHFGMTTEVQTKLQWSMDTLYAWNDITSQTLSENRFADAAERLTARACAALEPLRERWPALYDYMAKHDVPMSIDGFLNYYREKHGVRQMEG
ncbi:MAG: MBL fold metallo-hydrolase, partial [Dehalococcoidales bacterium]|nr:MBL fold metallo-hydrolase [Dehalococcoidales bacterium]